MEITGQLFDVVQGRQFPAKVRIADGKIASIEESTAVEEQILLPGFVDAHVHIESSMLTPSEFARLAVVHGTVATVSDPHEIGNVLGIQGVRWMIEDSKELTFKCHFGAPSCVPATSFETAGACISVEDIGALLELPEIYYLAEMMNFPGVLHGDPEVHAKLALAKKIGKPIDGHAPGLRGEEAARYASFGISTDHECFTAEEALDKLNFGMFILIREGSAAKNFEALIELLRTHPDKIMFCSDDKHPNDLIVGHIDQLVRRALRKKIDVWSVLRAASLNPVRHYRLPVGLLQVGDPADFIVADNLEDLTIRATYIDGTLVASEGKTLLPHRTPVTINRFSCNPLKLEELEVPAKGETLRVIQALDGQLITKEKLFLAQVSDGKVESDTENDVLKLVVVNRYRPSAPAIAFVQGFGLLQGALASSVAHDSHNIVAVGANDADLLEALNLVIVSEGGISVASGLERRVLALPIAGLMSAEDGYAVAEHYEALDKLAKDLGSTLPAPYMTLSFLALLVIPELKLSDLGLFDGRSFQFTGLFTSQAT